MLPLNLYSNHGAPMTRLFSLLAALGLALSSAAYAGDGAGCSEKAKAEKNKTSTLVEPAPETR
jgi:hypothetical protein